MRNILVDEDYIIKRYKEGYSIAKIAKELSVSPQTVHRRLIKNNVPRRVGDFQKGHKALPGCENGWFKKGQRSPAWKHGIRIQRGYRQLWDKAKQKYVMEHILLMEEHIGRRLGPDECVHHINHNPLDNRLCNLQLMTKKEHARLHAKKRYDDETSPLYKINNKS